MRRIIVLFTFILISTGITGCNSKDVQSSRIEAPITVDGIGSDWGDIPVTDFEDPNIFMGFGNTNDRLYILVGFNDQDLAQLFRMNGITLWLDGTGEREKETGIKYVPPPDRENSRTEGPEDDMSSEKRKLFEERSGKRSTGLSIVNRNGESYRLDPGGHVPEGAFKSEFGRYILEFMVPLRRDKSMPYAIDISDDTKISLGLEMGPPGNFADRRSFRRPGGGRGGGFPGGGGKTGGGRGGGFARQTFQTQEIRFSVQLADDVE